VDGDGGRGAEHDDGLCNGHFQTCTSRGHADPAREEMVVGDLFAQCLLRDPTGGRIGQFLTWLARGSWTEGGGGQPIHGPRRGEQARRQRFGISSCSSRLRNKRGWPDMFNKPRVALAWRSRWARPLLRLTSRQGAPLHRKMKKVPPHVEPLEPRTSRSGNGLSLSRIRHGAGCFGRVW
jgi:hypothetical protein